MHARLLAVVAAFAMSVGTATAEYNLTVLHTNDFHARFEPVSKYDSGCSEEDNAEGKCFGGSARIVLRKRRDAAATTSLLMVGTSSRVRFSTLTTKAKQLRN